MAGLLWSRSALTVAMVAGLLAVASSPAFASGGWSAPSNVSHTAEGMLAVMPQVVAAPDGSLVATWEAFTGSGYVVTVATSHDHGATWPEQHSLTPDGEHTESANLMVTDSGAVLVYWTYYGELDGHQVTVVRFSRSVDGGETWSPQASVSDPTQSSLFESMVSAGGDSVFLLFQSQGAIRARVSHDAGLSWSPFMDLGTGMFPDAAATSTGDLLATWVSGTFPNYAVLAASSHDLGANWSAAAQLSGAEFASYDVHVTAAGAHEFAVVWRDATGGGLRSVSTDTAGDAWSAPMLLGHANEFVNMISLAGRVTGVVSLEWIHDDGTTTHAVTASSVDGGVNWTDPVDVASTPTVGGFPAWVYPATIVAENGDIVAVWMVLGPDMSGADDRVFAATSSDEGVNWSEPTEISSECGAQPRLAANPDGSVTGVWECESTPGTIQVASATLNAPELGASLPSASTSRLAVTGIDASREGMLGIAGLAVGVVACVAGQRRRQCA